MSTDPNTTPLYSFFRPKLWEQRISSIDSVNTLTLNLFEAMLPSLEKLTIRKVADYLREAQGQEKSDYEAEIAALEANPEVDANYTTLVNKLNKQDDSQLLVFRHLFARLIEDRKLRVAATGGKQGLDFDFEAKQLLNINNLRHSLYNFAWNTFSSEIESLTESHRKNKTALPAFLIRDFLLNVTHDLEILQRAIVQRMRSNDDTDPDKEMSAHGQALLAMDKLAFLSLAPFEHLIGASYPINPITYYSQRTHLRRLLYSDNFVLIGVSYDHVSLKMNETTYVDAEGKPFIEPDTLPAFELMAIPHEVGHFVYHNAKPDGVQTFKQIGAQFKSNKYYHWCEEIFADVYGCVVSGVLTPIGLQSILVYSDERSWTEDDSEHPTPALRPFVLSRILDRLGMIEAEIAVEKAQAGGSTVLDLNYVLGREARSLEANWTAILEQQKRSYAVTLDAEQLPTKIVISATSTGPSSGSGCNSGQTETNTPLTLDVGQIWQEIRPIVDTFARLLLENVEKEPWDLSTVSEAFRPFVHDPSIPWAKEITTGALSDYDRAMEDLTTFKFAALRISAHLLQESENTIYRRMGGKSAEEILRYYGENWDIHGPSGTGGGSYGFG